MNNDLHIILSLFGSSAQLQKKRAMLTIAAIAWGTVAILLLLAFGEGLSRQLDKNRRSTAENFAVFWFGQTSKSWKGMPPGRPIRPVIDDVTMLRERMPLLKAVHGELQAGRVNVVYRRKNKSRRIVGVNWGYGDDRKHYPQAGGPFLGPENQAPRRPVTFALAPMR